MLYTCVPILYDLVFDVIHLSCQMFIPRYPTQMFASGISLFSRDIQTHDHMLVTKVYPEYACARVKNGRDKARLKKKLVGKNQALQKEMFPLKYK